MANCYLSPVIGTGTDADPYRPKIAVYTCNWVANYNAEGNSVLVVVNAADDENMDKIQGDTTLVDLGSESEAYRKFWQMQKVSDVQDFGAVGDGVTDDTRAIQKAMDYALTNSRKVYFPPGDYAVYSDTFAFYKGIFATLTNIDGFAISGDSARIMDKRKFADLKSYFPPVFLFDGCKNISVVGVNYRNEDTDYDIETKLGYIGAAYLMFLNNTENVTVDVEVYNARYGVKCGDYNNYQYNGQTGIVGLNVKIRANRVGYPVSVEMGSDIELDIVANVVHRAAYLCGVERVTLTAQVKDIYIADVFVLLSDTRYDVSGVTKYRGCKDCNISVSDIGSTHASVPGSLFGIQLYSFDTVRINAVEFRDLIFNGVISEITTAHIVAFATYFNTGNNADILDNIGINCIDLSPHDGCYVRVTSNDTKLIGSCSISVPAPLGYYMLELGAKTKIDIHNANINVVGYNNGSGITHFKDCHVAYITAAEPGYSCGGIQLETSIVDGWGHKDCFDVVVI